MCPNPIGRAEASNLLLLLQLKARDGLRKHKPRAKPIGWRQNIFHLEYSHNEDSFRRMWMNTFDRTWKRMVKMTESNWFVQTHTRSTWQELLHARRECKGKFTQVSVAVQLVLPIADSVHLNSLGFK